MTASNVLHLGIHKTATSHLQTFLDDQFGRAEGATPRFVRTREFRGKVTRALRGKNRNLQSAIASIDEFLAYPGSNIFSDENIVGSAGQMMKRRLYARPEFAQTVIERLSVRPLGVVLVIRDPVGFLPSLYSEYLRHNPFVEFDEWAPEDQVRSLRYRERFSWLTALPQTVRCRVVPFEPKHGGGLAKILQAVLSFLDLDEDECLSLVTEYSQLERSFDPKITRAGFSVEELERMREIKREVDGDAAKDFARRLQENLERFGETKFAPFTEAQARRIRESYQEDVAWARNAFAD